MLTLIEPYSTIHAVSFPTWVVSIEVYVVLTGCDGDVLVELRLTDEGERRPPVFRHLISARFDGPLDVREIVFHQYSVPIPAEGDYRLQIYVHKASDPVQGSGVFVLERKLKVNPASDESEGSQ